MPSSYSSSHSLSQRIRTHWETFTESERKLAEILAQPSFSIAGFTGKELAVLAGISTSGVVRFFQKLGYSSFNEVRRQQRDHSLDSPLSRTESGLFATRVSSHLIATQKSDLTNYVQTQIQLLKELPINAPQKDLDKAVLMLQGACRVFVLGMRASHVMASYAHAHWSQLRDDVFMLGNHANRPSEDLCQIRKGDLLVAIDFRRRSNQLASWLAVAKQRDAELLLISDTPVSGLTAMADLTLCCPNTRAHLFDSHLAAFALLHYLTSALASTNLRSTRKRLADIEALHEQLNDLAV